MSFEKDMPVFYFDSLKTSTLESAATTVYAQGGKGNSRLIAWEGEKTVTFTMEDALISALSLSILSGAGVIESAAGTETFVHATETVELDANGATEITYIAKEDTAKGCYAYVIPLDENGDIKAAPIRAEIDADSATGEGPYKATIKAKDGSTALPKGIYLLDYYYTTTSKVTQIDITPDKFAGNYYLEASTLFRNKDGIDLPAEFIIPNCKIQSNFTFTMASSGDPSTFTFTMDAFPDYTKYNKTTKVLAAIQILEDFTSTDEETVTYGADLDYTAPAAAASYSRRKSTTTSVSDEI